MPTPARDRHAPCPRSGWLVPTFATLVLLALFSWRAHAQSRLAPREGHEVYHVACAACHGDDGRGRPRSRVGFDVPLPDFSDCAFATPEPDADWIAVVHRGGPVRAFDRAMPAFGEALSEGEIASAVAHLRGFCADRSWPRGELNLPRPLVTEKAFPENEAVLTASVATGGPVSFDQELVYERRFGARNQVEVAVPFTSTGQGDMRRTGLGDVAIGVKRAIFHSVERGSIVSVATEVLFPTSGSRLGGSVTKIEPFVAVGQILPADSVVQGQAGIELSTDRGRVGHEAFWRAVIGRSFAQQQFGRTWSPMIEIVGVRGLEAGHTAEWDLIPQTQITLSTRQHIMASVGVRLPLNERAARHPRFLFYLLWDWKDGGLAAGW